MILRHMTTACLIYLSLVLQTSLASELTFFEFRPWFPGVALAACVLLHNTTSSVIWASVLGLAIDGLSAERLGLHAILATFVASGLLMARQEIRSFQTMLTGLFVFAGTVVWKSLSAVVLGLIGNQPMAIHESLISGFESAAYTSLIAVSLQLVVSLGQRVLRKRRDSVLPILTNQWSMLTR